MEIQMIVVSLLAAAAAMLIRAIYRAEIQRTEDDPL
jgi:hypothetical protein